MLSSISSHRAAVCSRRLATQSATNLSVSWWMRLAAQEAANRIHQETERFVADCVASLREQTAALCDEMLESIRTSETGVHQKTLNRLVRFIDQFRQMNFAGDSEMEQQLDNVRRELLSR